MEPVKKAINKEQIDHWMPMIDALPQAKHIPKERRLRWLEATYNIDGERLEWHIERLKGFGGSEIGALVLGMEGKPGRMTQARYVVMSKLMMIPPDAPTHAMTMGTLGEPLVQSHFLKQYNGISLTDEIARFKGKVHSRLPWMRVTPDDVVELTVGTASVRILADYKLPTEAVMDEYRESSDIDYEYGCQLTQGMMMAKDLGIRVDTSFLVNLDTKQKESGYVNVREFSFNKELAAKMIKAGEHYYAMVMHNELPELIGRKVLTTEDIKGLEEVLVEVTPAMIAYKAAEDNLEAVKDRFKALMEGRDLEGKVENQLVDIGVKNTLNPDRLMKEARAAGIDVEAMTVTKTVYDTKAIVEALKEEKPEVIDNVYNKSHFPQLPRGKKSVRVKEVSKLSVEANTSLRQALDNMHDELLDILNNVTDTTYTKGKKEEVVDAELPRKDVKRNVIDIASRHAEKKTDQNTPENRNKAVPKRPGLLML